MGFYVISLRKWIQTHAMEAATGIRRTLCHKLYETYDLGESIWEFH
jgi:hypothetical protein